MHNQSIHIRSMIHHWFTKRTFLILFSGLLGWFGINFAYANGLEVSPTMLLLKSNQVASQLWISHTAQTDLNHPMYAQIRVFRWTQAENQDRLIPTNQLIVTPPFFVVQGQTPQLVRVLRTNQIETDSSQTPLMMAQGNEQSYRLIVDQIPKRDHPGGGLMFVMHYSIPVFIAPAHPTHPWDVSALTWHWVVEKNLVYLQITNPTSFHAQIVNVSALLNGQWKSLNHGLMGYVLPEKTMQFKVPLSPSELSKTHQIQVWINGQEQHAEVTP